MNWVELRMVESLNRKKLNDSATAGPALRLLLTSCREFLLIWDTRQISPNTGLNCYELNCHEL